MHLPARSAMNSPSTPPPAPALSAGKFFNFQSLQARLIAMLLLLLIGLQAILFVVISGAAHRSAMRASGDALQLTASSLQSVMAARENNLLRAARLLSADYAFKSMVGESDAETILSAFGSYQKRLNADWMFLLDLDGRPLADTMAGPGQSDFARVLLKAANRNEARESAGIVLRAGQTYQVVLVPLNAPQQIAWVGIGFAITDQLARELEQQTHTQVSLTWQDAASGRQILASTLSRQQREELLRTTAKTVQATPLLNLAGVEFVSLALPLNQLGDGVLVAVLQRPLDEALSSYHALRWQLLSIFLLSTLLATISGIVLAKRITQPVARLAAAASKISAGEYQSVPTLTQSGQNDEIGALAQAFDNMVRGLIERDQVRSLLGKVVSPRVAEELLSRKIELGGEEREVTLLFSDIRDFTTLSEGRAPSAILGMLNTYLSAMSSIIDQEQGVVDKYIGDAVMALFGAPVNDINNAERAMLAAMRMMAVMPELNRQFAAGGWPELKIGIAVHTGIVVAGNVGSESRLNYTVLGDNVNLAARLEGLCKKYQVGVIASAAAVAHCPHFYFRELDKVRVKGKREAVRIYQALGTELDAQQVAQLEQHRQALALYREARFEESLQAFLALPEDAVSLLYRARCAKMLKYPPAEDWDAIETLDEK